MKITAFCDADGTLLNSDHLLSKENRDAITKFQGKGNRFVIVSGRSPNAIDIIRKPNGINCASIPFGGALVLDEENKIISQRRLDRDISEKIYTYFESCKYNHTLCLYTKDNWIVKTRNDPNVIKEEQIVLQKAIECSIFDIPKDETIYKMLCICRSGELDLIEKDIKRYFPSIFTIKSNEHQMEIMTQGISKSSAVKLYCDYYKISLNDTIAIGDSYNDVDMLRIAGKAFVMGNAPDTIKVEFGNITHDNNHNGVAEVLRNI